LLRAPPTLISAPPLCVAPTFYCLYPFSLFSPFQFYSAHPHSYSAHLHCTPHFFFAHPLFLNLCTPVFTSYTSTIDNLAPLFMFILFWACVLCSLHAPPLPHAPLFYLIHLHVYHFFSSRTSVYDNPAPPPGFFYLLGFCCIFTSSRTSTITNPAPLHTLFTPILGLFYILFATPPLLIKTPHLLHVPPTNYSCTPMFCFPLSSSLINLLFYLFTFLLLLFIFVFFLFLKKTNI